MPQKESASRTPVFENNTLAETAAMWKHPPDSGKNQRKLSLLPNSLKRWWEGDFKGLRKFRSFRFEASKVYPEDCELKKRKIWDPRDKLVQQWNKIFVISCLVAVSVDPLFFFLPSISDNVCVEIDKDLAIVVAVVRTFTDIFYMLHIIFKFKTGYVAPSSRFLGRGDLVTDSWLIAKKYLAGNFALDLVAVLPLPQVAIWLIIPAMKGTMADNAKTALRFIVFFQYLPRLYRIFPLTHQVVKATGVVTETAWGGAAYNLLLFVLASHVLGASWYLLAIEREDTCWRSFCRTESMCKMDYFDCGSLGNLDRLVWLNGSNIRNACNADSTVSTYFNFGIYVNALVNDITSSKRKFIEKYFYCLCWGFQNLSALGQNLGTSTYIWEMGFAMSIAIIGLVLFALLIGNMQTYLQSLTVRLEGMRLKRRDTEQWMHHRQLPPELQERVRRYEQYKWLETRGVNEEDLIKSLPKDLRRDITRHLCLELVQGVPLFASMDEQLLDAICEKLKPTLFTDGTDVVREGDPVTEMLFIIRGHLKSETTNGGRTGFLNVGELKPGDFCGEELLTWALDPKAGGNFPLSTRSVTATTEVEGFALKSEDLKFVASQFRRLHSRQVQNTFRFYSQQWQTWAACSIQAAWNRYKRRKLAELNRKGEKKSLQPPMSGSDGLENMIHTSSPFSANAMNGVYRLRDLQASERKIPVLKLKKPAEPDFSVEW